MLRPSIRGPSLPVLATAVCIAVVSVSPLSSRAQDAASRTVAVLPLEGTGGDTIRDALIRELGRAGVSAEARVAARATDVAATIEGDVRRRGRRRTLRLVARASDGRELGAWSATRRDPSDLAPALAARVADTIRDALAEPPTSTPAAERGAPRPYRFGDAPVADDPRGRPAPRAARREPVTPAEVGPTATAIELTAGFRLRSRSFSYHDDLFGEHSGYDLAGAPIVFADATFFPGALSRTVLAHIGIEARGEVAVGVSSRRSDGGEHGTRFHALATALTVRLPMVPVEIRPHAGYGIHDFAFDGASGGQTPLPDVRYEHLLVGTSVIVHVADVLDVRLRGSWLPVLSLGEIGEPDWFPHATGGGVEAELGATFMVGAGLGIRVSGEWRRFFLSMNPEPGDAHVAGGAVDQHLGGSVGLEWRPD